jgi:hypothetical protein
MQSIITGPQASILGKGRALSPNYNANRTRDHFDFSAFVKFLIKIRIKCLPQVQDKPEAVLMVVEKYILPLQQNLKDDRAIQNSKLNKLIQLANTDAIVDFMGDLFQVVSDNIYPVYSNAKGLMNFEGFASFSRDHDIFPSLCSKAALYRIFHNLSTFSEAINPVTQVKFLIREMSNLDMSAMSPRALETLQKSAPEMTIDKNLFVEAITLSALSTDDKDFNK